MKSMQPVTDMNWLIHYVVDEMHQLNIKINFIRIESSKRELNTIEQYHH